MASQSQGPTLLKHKSWSPDSSREQSWIRRKGIHRDRRLAGSRSVTDEDLDELRGCVDLGFSLDPALSATFPALDLYYSLHRRGDDSPSPTSSSSSSTSSPLSIYTPGENPQQVKAKLKQWAQVVACSVRQQL